MAVPLLDTHDWIWWIEGDRRLPRRVRDTLDQLPRDERPYQLRLYERLGFRQIEDRGVPLFMEWRAT